MKVELLSQETKNKKWIKVPCGRCGNLTSIRSYRLKKQKRFFCNGRCANEFRFYGKISTIHQVHQGQKICLKCKQWQTLSKFYKNSVYTDGYSTRCRECVKKINNNRKFQGSKNWIQVTCARCKRTFFKSPSLVKDRIQHFCRKRCKALFQYNGSRPRRKPRQICSNCKEIFEGHPLIYQPKKLIFCSKVCKMQYFFRPCSNCRKLIRKEPNQNYEHKNLFCDNKCAAEWRKKNLIGELAPNWQGGLSFEPYSAEFNENLKEQIRLRDGYVCQLCGLVEILSEKALSVHHINYDKKNCDLSNLISLCVSCNFKVNFNRKKWKKYFRNKLAKRFKKQLFLQLAFHKGGF